MSGTGPVQNSKELVPEIEHAQPARCRPNTVHNIAMFVVVLVRIPHFLSDFVLQLVTILEASYEMGGMHAKVCLRHLY